VSAKENWEREGGKMKGLIVSSMVFRERGGGGASTYQSS